MAHKKLIKELERQGITNRSVLSAISHIPRDKFVLDDQKERAYENSALPILCHQTISQPYIVALMSESLFEHHRPQKILEIGTGSGYQTAILADLFKHVWTIERIEALYLNAKKLLHKLHYNNISYRLGDGSQGWPEKAPFDGIIVTAAAATIPPKLLQQLDPNGGVMIIPLGSTQEVQKLTLVKKQDHEIEMRIIELVSFVPLIEDPF
jgi:protein-L-isoaspartate(D-aspartate) O-methyltransferase